MRSYEEMDYHPVSERLVDIISDSDTTQEKLFFRTVVGYYFCTMAASMHCTIETHEGDDIPVNMYAVPLGPSGFGKTRACKKMENKVVDQFRHRFLEQTFPLLAEQKLQKLAVRSSLRNSTDPDDERPRIDKVFDNQGPLLYNFDSATEAAIRQAGSKIKLGGGGALNLQMDEVGMNLSENMKALAFYLVLFDQGESGNNLIKNTKENQRVGEVPGMTPANALMFGVQSILLNGGVTEDNFMQLLATGFGRRCFFAFVNTAKKRLQGNIDDDLIDEIYDRRTSSQATDFLDECSDKFAMLADQINMNTKLRMSKSVAKLFIEYHMICEKKANEFKEHQEIERNEMTHRYFKSMKLAGAYAFVDESPEITEEHAYNAIKVAEDSGVAFHEMLDRPKPYMKLANYIADFGRPVTQADLANDLPYYKGGKQAKDDLMQMAIAYGYQNNIVIKRDFSDGIEFLRGETLDETDLSNMIVSYSDDMAYHYQNDFGAWEDLHKMTQAQGMHWTNHHFKTGHRSEDDATEGFNIVVVDVDGEVSLEIAKELLKDYKALFYTTKRHGQDGKDRFRILLPTNFVLKLDQKDFKTFMKNVFDWLPFDSDTQTGQRNRKWLSHAGHYEYTDGDLLDVLPFIPKTSKNDAMRKNIDKHQSLDNLERWFMANTGDGNRNNQLLRYAMILVDTGRNFDEIRRSVLELNYKLPDNLPEAEIMGTVMTTVGRALATKQAA